MKKMALVLGSLFGLFVFVSGEEMAVSSTPAPQVVVPAGASMELVNSALGSGVDRETRMIQGESASFDGSVPQVHYLTRVKSEVVPTTIQHVYTADGKEVASVSLDVKGSPWTTWSHKTVWPGDWKVELKDEAGNVVESKEFTVSKDMDVPEAEAPVSSEPQ